MKHFINSFIVIVLAVCCMMPLNACANTKIVVPEFSYEELKQDIVEVDKKIEAANQQIDISKAWNQPLRIEPSLEEVIDTAFKQL